MSTSKHYTELRQRVRTHSETVREICKHYAVNRWFVEYWQNKLAYSETLFDGWGGIRRRKFKPDEMARLKAWLWLHCQNSPLATLAQFCNLLAEDGYQVNRMFVSRIFRKWRWSFKKPSIKQIHKYKPENMIYYVQFVHWVETIPWKSFKYFDETHCKSTDTF